MTIEFFLGSNLSTTHERKALISFLEAAYLVLAQRKEPYVVLANYHIAGRQVDLTILKPDGILVGDFKECDSPFTATENGPWQIVDSTASLGTEKENPYQQLKELRNIWIDFLADKAAFTQGVSKTALRKFVHGAVVINPVLPANTVNRIPKRVVWFHLLGLTDLARECLVISQPTIAIPKEELTTLACKHLNLSYGDIHTGMFPAPVFPVPAPPQFDRKEMPLSQTAIPSVQQPPPPPISIPIPRNPQLPSLAQRTTRQKGTLPSLFITLGIVGAIFSFCFCCSSYFFLDLLIPNKQPDPVSQSYIAKTQNSSTTEPMQKPTTDTVEQQIFMLQHTKIAYVFDGNLYLMNPYGTDQTQLTNFTNGIRVLESPSWSPDGKHIVFSAGMDNNSDLFIINLATKEIYPLLDTTAYLTDPNWSAADNMIYYSSNEDGNFNIFRVTPEGDSPERVLDFPSAEYYPSKSSDGKYLIFQSNMSGKRDIYRVQMDDLSLLRLSREQYDLTRPKWRPLHNEVSYIHVETSFFTTYYFKLLQVDNLSVIIYHTLMHDVINSNSRYDWSPDGSLIVFSGNYLCIFNASMQEMSGLSCDYKGAVFPSWSPILLEE